MVLAKEAGLCYAAVALATDYDCWRDSGERVCVADVLAMFKKNVGRVCQLLKTSVPIIAQQDWDSTIDSLQVSLVAVINKKNISEATGFLGLPINVRKE